MAEAETIITTRTACEALAPEKMTEAEFNAMTQTERDAAVGYAAAYQELCGGQ